MCLCINIYDFKNKGCESLVYNCGLICLQNYSVGDTVEIKSG